MTFVKNYDEQVFFFFIDVVTGKGVLWRHSATEISNGLAAQSAISLKRNAHKPNVQSTSLRFFRRIFGRMHTRQPSRTSNKHARSGDIEGQQTKESAWF